MLVVSPFSRGGHIATEVFDHTSQLKLLSERFGIEVPNVVEVAAGHGRRPDLGAVPRQARHVDAGAAQDPDRHRRTRPGPASPRVHRDGRRGADDSDQAGHAHPARHDHPGEPLVPGGADQHRPGAGPQRPQHGDHEVGPQRAGPRPGRQAAQRTAKRPGQVGRLLLGRPATTASYEASTSSNSSSSGTAPSIRTVFQPNRPM